MLTPSSVLTNKYWITGISEEPLDIIAGSIIPIVGLNVSYSDRINGSEYCIQRKIYKRVTVWFN